MQLSNSKKFILGMLGLIILGAILFAWETKVRAKPTEDRQGYIKQLVGSIDVKQGTKKTLLETYCKALTDSNIQEGLVEGGMYFTPKYSLFVAALCQPFAENDSSMQPFNASKDDILKKNFSRARFLGSVPSGCDPSSTMENCDLSDLLPKIFTRVMNDHSILSIAGWTFGLAEEGNNNDSIRDKFSMGYFGNIGKICGDKDDMYLGTKSSSSNKNALCSHPKTASYLDSYINKLKQQANKIQTLEVGALQGNIDKPSSCVTTGGANGTQASLLLCSYDNNIPGDAGPNQTNLRYNELLFYKTLVAWLTTKLDDPNFGPIRIGQAQEVSSTASGGNDERLNLQREIILSQKALVLMQKNVYNFRATFPLHIGLLAYYEDVLALRKSMAKMYTPIHQLYYKLRNVQAK